MTNVEIDEPGLLKMFVSMRFIIQVVNNNATEKH